MGQIPRSIEIISSFSKEMTGLLGHLPGAAAPVPKKDLQNPWVRPIGPNGRFRIRELII